MNIGEIATLAGVSRATVSRYLNNGYVSQANKDKIQKVIDETGYVPSIYAKSLRSKKSNLIGVIIPRISSEAVSRVVDGITQALAAQGYDILLGNTNLNGDKEIEYLRIFEKNQVEGIIFLATVITPEHMKVMQQLTVPLVIVGQEVDGFTAIYHDDYRAAFTMTEHLIQQGYQHIGFIGVTQKDKAVGYERQRGYREALQAYGRVCTDKMIVEGTFTAESGYACMRQLKEAQPELDAVFCVTDIISIGAMRYLREQNIAIPKGVGVGSIGDYMIAKAVVPSLTTMHYYYEQSGIEAAKLILEYSNEGSTVNKQIQLGYALQTREST